MTEEFEDMSMYEDFEEKIVAAAILGEFGEPNWLPRPARHHDVIRHMVRVVQYKPPIMGEQGFMTNMGRFVDRIEGMAVAKKAGQLRTRMPGQYQGAELFSEDLW